MSDEVSNIHPRLDPNREGSLSWSGRNADGTITVLVQVKVAVEDEVGLRAAMLLPTTEISPDWGVEAAAMMAVAEVLRRAAWAGTGVRPVQFDYRSGQTAGVTPEDQIPH